MLPKFFNSYFQILLITLLRVGSGVLRISAILETTGIESQFLIRESILGFQKLHQAVLKSVDMAKKNIPPIMIDKKIFTKMNELLEELASTIEEDKKTYEVLEKISVLMYSISGNGYYLQQKGFKVVEF